VIARDLDWRLERDASGAALGAPLPLERVVRQSVGSDGVRLVAPCLASFAVTARSGDRLRLRFSRAAPPGLVETRPRRRTDLQPEPGSGRPGIDLVLRDPSGRLDTAAAIWTAGEGWHEVELDLTPLAGAETRLQLEVGPEPGEVLVGGVLQLRPATVRRPDVILYVEDALRADRLGSYGYEGGTDPHLSRIAAEGVRFARGFAAANWTRPSVSTLFTGLDVADHGVTFDGGRIPDAAVTLAEEYARAGYVTAAFVSNIHAGTWAGLERGFDVHYDRKAFPRTKLDSSLSSGLINEQLLPFLERHRDELLFVYVHTTDPHEPYRSPSEDLFAVMDGGATRSMPPDVPDHLVDRWHDWTMNYDGEIHHNDRSLQRLDESLDALGLMRDTLLVFTSDHGEGFHEHGQWGHRRSVFNEELFVPLVMRWPAVIPVGRVVEDAVTHLDIPTTLLALCELQPPSGWAGRDLSLLWGEAPGGAAGSRPILAWGETPDGPVVAVIRYPWKLIAAQGPDRLALPLALHDLESDPAERHDRLRDPGLRSVVEALLPEASDYFGRHARASAEGPPADPLSGLDEDDLDWLRAMGYLR